MTSYNVYQPSLGGSLGSGIAKGLAEQLPVEIGRQRLASGLKQFEKEAGNLTPMQQYVKLLSIPGLKESPQALQTFGELARSQAMANAFGQGGIQPSIVEEQTGIPADKSEAPSITQKETTKEAIKPYLPRTQEEKDLAAKKRFDANKAMFGGIFQNARDYEEQIENSNIQRSAALQAAGQSQKKVEDRLKLNLDLIASNYGIPKEISGTTLRDVYQKAIKEVLEGKTEAQAAEDAAKELDVIGKEYKSIENLTPLYPEEFKRIANDLEKKFAHRKASKDLGDLLIAKQNLGSMHAYSLAQPVKNIKPLQKELNDMPDAVPLGEVVRYDRASKYYPKLLEKMGKQGSPLAVAYHLRQKGYDPARWFEFLDENRGELTGDQEEQLSKPLNYTMEDIWIKNMGKISKFLGF